MFILPILVACTSLISAEEFYIAPNGKPSNDGSEDSPWNLEKANASLRPGDTAILLDGIYTDIAIQPEHSGTVSSYISYKAKNKHKALFQDMGDMKKGNGPTVVSIDKKSYIVIDGIKSIGVQRWVVGTDAHHITLKNCHFEEGSGWMNVRFRHNGDGMKVLECFFSGGTDLVTLDGGKGHLIEGNFFGDATHTGLTLLGVTNSIVRNNRFNNRRWRCMEMESMRHPPYTRSQHNLIENNIFEYSPVKGIQFAGNNTIIRKNLFIHCLSAFGFTNYVGSNKGQKKRSPEAWHVAHNRFYNNVIAHCGNNSAMVKKIEMLEKQGFRVAEKKSSTGYAIGYSTNMFNPKLKDYPDCAYEDNICKNNILYRNRNVKQFTDKRGPRANTQAQIFFDWNATPAMGIVHNNLFFNRAKETEVFYYYDAILEKPSLKRNATTADFQKRYPENFRNNVELDPRFIDPEQANFQLLPDSPCIDGGGALTHAVADGAGDRIPVKDSLYFSDGYGIKAPDILRIGPYTVKVVSINYQSHEIRLSETITWKKGDAVNLTFKGQAPDLGMFETK